MRKSKEMIDAIIELVMGYKNGDVEHSTSVCPLCKVFFIEGGSVSKSKCLTRCPNKAFQTRFTIFPCLDRCHSYPKLDFRNGNIYKSNDNVLHDFWAEVLDMVIKSAPKENLKPKILLIAKKYR